MKYSEAREKIKSGDVLAFSHEGWKSWRDIKTQMVRIFTRSEYSHIATAWVIGGRVLVIDATIPATRIFPLSKMGSFYWMPVNTNWDNAEPFALSYVGIPYSQWAAIKAFFNKLRKDSTEECAALAKTILSKGGVELSSRPTPDGIVKNLLELGTPLTYVVQL